MDIINNYDCKISVINATRLDYDHKLDWNKAFGKFPPIKVNYDEVGVDPSDDEIINRSIGYEILVTKEIQVSNYVIENLSSTVKIIIEAGTGFNNIALDACRKRNILVMNIPNYSNDAVASLVITFILNFSCSLMLQHKLIGNNLSNFKSCLSPTISHFEVAGKTLGLVGGRGSIGSKVTQIALVLGMKVLISTRSLPHPTSTSSTETSSYDTNPNIRYVTSLDELLQESDFVSLHCPLTADTRHLINKKTLALMKPTAFLINTARGGLVNEVDLVQALTATVDINARSAPHVNKIAGAGLDVQDPEPPSDDSLLYKLPNVILTPHIGWKRLETRQRLIECVANNVDSYLNNVPTNVVSPI